MQTPGKSPNALPAGTLHVVATPIGNLGDISARALETLRSVAAICAEDTRRTRPLLQQFGIDTPLIALHDHNEDEIAERLVVRLVAGESLALVSDAGTPLISDPGYRLVRAAREAGVRVSPVPGAAALIAALSVAGLPSDRFAFEGFLPAKAGGRRDRLQALAGECGHIVISEKTKKCACGGMGHAESYASADRAEAEAKKIGHPADFKLLWQDRDNPKIKTILAPIITSIAKTIATVTVTFDPEITILNGGMSRAEGIVQMLENTAKNYLPTPFTPHLKIEKSKLQADAALYGAVAGFAENI